MEYDLEEGTRSIDRTNCGGGRAVGIGDTSNSRGREGCTDGMRKRRLNAAKRDVNNGGLWRNAQHELRHSNCSKLSLESDRQAEL